MKHLHQSYKVAADRSEIVSSTSLGTGYHAYADLTHDGAFLYRLTAGDASVTRRMLLVR